MTMIVTTRWLGLEVALKEREGAARGLYLWAEEVLKRAVDIVPLDLGPLLESGIASPPDPGTLRAAVSFDTPYACRQHEELTWVHAPGRQAKYLEQPANDSRGVGLLLVQREMKTTLT